MPNGWIIDVLLDLQSFARMNDMPDLDTQLEQTLDVARNSLSRDLGAEDAKPDLVGSFHIRE